MARQSGFSINQSAQGLGSIRTVGEVEHSAGLCVHDLVSVAGLDLERHDDSGGVDRLVPLVSDCNRLGRVEGLYDWCWGSSIVQTAVSYSAPCGVLCLP